jgi:hypothetical protein
MDNIDILNKAELDEHSYIDVGVVQTHDGTNNNISLIITNLFCVNIISPNMLPRVLFQSLLVAWALTNRTLTLL